MIRSFKSRLIWLSVLVSGLALVGFAAGSWWLIRSIQVERLDSDVQAHAEREVGRQRTAESWGHFERNVLTNFGARAPDQLLLLVQDGAGDEVYRSRHWPAAFETDRLPWPTPQSHSGRGPWIRLMRPPPPGQPFPPDSGGGPAPMASPELLPMGPRPASSVIYRQFGGVQWRVALGSVDSAHVLIAVSTAVIDRDMIEVRNAFLVAIPFALVLIGLGAWALSSRAMRPIKKLTAATRLVTAQGLDQRLSSQSEDREFVELKAVFNDMLERLERSFKQATRFSADAAHELKTPLAILQGQLERALHQAPDGSALQGELTSILDEVRRLSTISRKLLLLSQADAGQMRVFKEPFDLSVALEDLQEDIHMLAPDMSVTGEIEPHLHVLADGGLLRQVLHNLISNAIKYNQSPGWITLRAHATDQWVEVAVANASAGMAALDESKLFERFYRADTSHNRQVDGVGLGLSLSREIARAHGGDLRLRAHSDKSVEFVLQLPKATH